MPCGKRLRPCAVVVVDADGVVAEAHEAVDEAVRHEFQSVGGGEGHLPDEALALFEGARAAVTEVSAVAENEDFFHGSWNLPHDHDERAAITAEELVGREDALGEAKRVHLELEVRLGV